MRVAGTPPAQGSERRLEAPAAADEAGARRTAVVGGLDSKSAMDEEDDAAYADIGLFESKKRGTPKTQRWRARHAGKNLTAANILATVRERVPPLCESRQLAAAWVPSFGLTLCLCAATMYMAEDRPPQNHVAAARPLLLWVAAVGWSLLVIQPLALCVWLCWTLRPTRQQLIFRAVRAKLWILETKENLCDWLRDRCFYLKLRLRGTRGSRAGSARISNAPRHD